MPIKSFARPSSATPAAAPRKKKSLWDGLTGAFERTPQPAEGSYRLRFKRGEAKEENQRTGNATAHFYFEIVLLDELAEKEHAVGDEVDAFFITNGKSRVTSMNRIFSLMTALAGFENVEDYREFDPDGECYLAAMGESNSYSEEGKVVDGRLVDVEVRRGKTAPDGGYYREYSWAPVPDDEQTPAE